MIGITCRRSMVIKMDSKQELLHKYDKPNQDTKRAIIRHLYNNTDTKHDSSSVFESVKDECWTGKRIVKNQVSNLANETDLIAKRKNIVLLVGE